MVTIHVGDGHPIVTRTIERNSKCGCGSGKKAKNCHGVNTEFYSSKPKPVGITEQEQKAKDAIN